MRTAKESANARVKQLKRQRMNWFIENSNDQGDYIRILDRIDSKEAELEVLKTELAELEKLKREKEQEMTGENKSQIEKYDQLIKEAEQTADDL